MDKFDIRSMILPEIEALMAEWNEPAYRAAQIFSWIHQQNAETFDTMTNLPLKLRGLLSEHCRFTEFETAGKAASKADEAIKYLFALEKNTIIESVFMRHGHGSTLCVSTQAGCRMGCRFCASTAGGLQRNLTAGEMCAQLYAARRDTDTRVDGVVMMGCGEPLDNYDASVRFISLISHPSGQAIGQRHITLSTCGLVPQMLALAELKLPITLAVSLHAPNDAIRRSLMPVARRYTIRETLEACDYYVKNTHRRITFEYALAANVNDSDDCARELCGLLAGRLCHVNLIPINEISNRSLQPASDRPIRERTRESNTPTVTQSRRADAFARCLSRRGIPVTIRRSLGGDIQAACGQLRGRHMGIL